MRRRKNFVWRQNAGRVGVALAALAFYAALALELDGVAHEPGVRRQL